MSNQKLNGIKAKAQCLESFLKEKGHKVKHAECIEAVSQMETGSCYNIAKNKSVRILKIGEVLSYKEMQSTDFNIDVVIPIDMNVMMSGIEEINDVASETITSLDYCLCDIDYEVYPYFYNTDKVAIRVTGYVDPEDLEDLENIIMEGLKSSDDRQDEDEDEDEDDFYSDLYSSEVKNM